MPANPNGSQMTSPESGESTPNPYAPTTWGNAYEDLEVPSGQTCLVQRLAMSALMEGDLLDDFDMLTSLVQTEHVSKKSRSSGRSPGKAKQAEQQAEKIMGDKDNIAKALRITDAVVSKVVVQPHIWKAPDKDEEGNELIPRIPGRVYIDQVADEDKGFILNWAFGGTRDLQRFREELSEVVGSVAAVKDLAQTSQ